MSLYFDDGSVRFYLGDVREQLDLLPPSSVQTVVTSPPYWGLRDYGTATWDGGDAECAHAVRRWDGPKQTQGAMSGHAATRDRLNRDQCECGARRIDRQIGLEATPDAFVVALVDVFREVRRVLRDDGTAWVNLGDSYAGSWGAQGRDGEMAARAIVSARQVAEAPRKGSRTGAILQPGLKAKDLCGIPWRVALALQADGWYLRSDIIWAKPNPMPESVTDRPTKAHEYVFLLSKSPRYYYDADAIREEGAGRLDVGDMNVGARLDSGAPWPNQTRAEAGRNKRTVWTIATEAYKGAHFATFPTGLVLPCILAGTPEGGSCSVCGAPMKRVTVRKEPIPFVPPSQIDRFGNGEAGGQYQKWLDANPKETLAWRPTCTHDDVPAVPATVLDPFSGSGTVAQVAKWTGRHAVGIDLSAEYLDLAKERILKEPRALRVAKKTAA